MAADDWNAQGPSLCGKSRIMQTLTQALTEDKEQPAPHKLVVMNPKARCEVCALQDLAVLVLLTRFTFSKNE